MDAEIPIGFVCESFCCVHLSAHQAIPQLVWTQAQFDTITYDNNNEFDINTWCFIPKVSGYYHIDCCTAILSLAVFVLQGLRIYVNSIVKAAEVFKVTGSDYSCLRQSADLYLVSNDVITIYVYHAAGANRNLVKNNDLTYLNIHRFA